MPPAICLARAATLSKQFPCFHSTFTASVVFQGQEMHTFFIHHHEQARNVRKSFRRYRSSWQKKVPVGIEKIRTIHTKWRTSSGLRLGRFTAYMDWVLWHRFLLHVKHELSLFSWPRDPEAFSLNLLDIRYGIIGACSQFEVASLINTTRNWKVDDDLISKEPGWFQKQAPADETTKKKSRTGFASLLWRRLVDFQTRVMTQNTHDLFEFFEGLDL